jgi:hypothetical protein
MVQRAGRMEAARTSSRASAYPALQQVFVLQEGPYDLLLDNVF